MKRDGSDPKVAEFTREFIKRKDAAEAAAMRKGTARKNRKKQQKQTAQAAAAAAA